MGNTLSELTREFSEFEAMVLEAGGELTQELQTIEEDLFPRLLSKIDGYQYIMQRAEHNAALWKDRAKEATRVSKASEKLRERLRERLTYYMRTSNMERVEGDYVGYRLQNSPAKLEIDEALLP